MWTESAVQNQKEDLLLKSFLAMSKLLAGWYESVYFCFEARKLLSSPVAGPVDELSAGGYKGC